MTQYWVLDLQNLSSEDFDGEMIAVNFGTGKYYGMKGCAQDIWHLLETPMTESAVIDEISRLFEKTDETQAPAIQAFIDTLRSEGILLCVEKPGTDTTSARSTAGKKAFAAPELEVHTDLQELIMLDPVHDTNIEQGWPVRKDETTT